MRSHDHILSRKSTEKPVGERSDGDKPHVQTNQNIIWLAIYIYIHRGVVMGYNQSHGNGHGINNIGF